MTTKEITARLNKLSTVGQEGKFFIDPTGRVTYDEHEHIEIIYYQYPELWKLFKETKVPKDFDEENDKYGLIMISYFEPWMNSYLVNQLNWIRGGVWENTFYLVLPNSISSSQKDKLYNLSLSIMKREGSDLKTDITSNNRNLKYISNIKEFITSYF